MNMRDRLLRCGSRRRRVGGTLAALLFFLFLPAQPAADGLRNRQEAHPKVIQVRSLLGRQALNLEEEALDALARSIVAESERHTLDAMLLLAVIHVESRFDPQAVSSQGAQGLMQIRPIAVTALLEEEKISSTAAGADLQDPLWNMHLGASYLAYLKEMFGDLKVSLTAYHQGPSRVRNRIAAREQLSFAYADEVLSVRRAFEKEVASNDAA